MKIRPFTARDVRGMIAVARKLHPRWIPEVHIATMPVDFRCQRGLVAVERKRIVGYVSYVSEDGIPRITRLGVSPALHRKGIGKRLVAAVEREVKRAGAKALQVEAMGWTRPVASQHADTMRFYAALGFKTVRKHPIHVEAGGRWRIYTLEKRLGRAAG